MKAGLCHTEFLVFLEMYLAAHQRDAVLRFPRAVVLPVSQLMQSGPSEVGSLTMTLLNHQSSV